MSNAAKSGANGGALQPAEQDVLHFLSRTLQAHCLDAEPQHVLAKLKNLQRALSQQEITLADWPDSPSKERICAALVKARNVVSQIVDDLGAETGKYSAVSNVKAIQKAM